MLPIIIIMMIIIITVTIILVSIYFHAMLHVYQINAIIPTIAAASQSMFSFI